MSVLNGKGSRMFLLAAFLGLIIVTFIVPTQVAAQDDDIDVIIDQASQNQKAATIRTKQNDLIRQLVLKYGLVSSEETLIGSITDIKKLDAAIEKFALCENKDEVMGVLS